MRQRSPTWSSAFAPRRMYRRRARRHRRRRPWLRQRQAMRRLQRALGVPARPSSGWSTIPSCLCRPPVMPTGSASSAGTGSIAVARTREGRMLAAGGWGWILGDEGSAAGSGARGGKGDPRRGRRGPARRSADRRPCGRTRHGRSHHARPASQRHPRRRRLGPLRQSVFQAADSGSALACRVIDEGGKALAALVGLLIAARRRRHQSWSRAAASSSSSRCLWKRSARGIAAVSPASKVVLLRDPPVHRRPGTGRARLALSGGGSSDPGCSLSEAAFPRAGSEDPPPSFSPLPCPFTRKSSHDEKCHDAAHRIPRGGGPPARSPRSHPPRRRQHAGRSIFRPSPARPSASPASARAIRQRCRRELPACPGPARLRLLLDRPL